MGHSLLNFLCKNILHISNIEDLPKSFSVCSLGPNHKVSLKSTNSLLLTYVIFFITIGCSPEAWSLCFYPKRKHCSSKVQFYWNTQSIPFFFYIYVSQYFWINNYFHSENLALLLILHWWFCPYSCLFSFTVFVHKSSSSRFLQWITCAAGI